MYVCTSTQDGAAKGTHICNDVYSTKLLEKHQTNCGYRSPSIAGHSKQIHKVVLVDLLGLQEAVDVKEIPCRL